MANSKENLKKIGTNLQNYRLSRGITQAEISARIGLSRQGYSDYERGKCEISLQNILKLADAFGTAPLKFMNILGVENYLSSILINENNDVEIATIQFLNSLHNTTYHNKPIDENDLNLFSTLIINALEILKQKYNTNT